MVGLAVVPWGRLTLTSFSACDCQLCTTAVATANSSTTPKIVQALFVVDTIFFPQSAVMPSVWAFESCERSRGYLLDGPGGAEIRTVTEGVWRGVNNCACGIQGSGGCDGGVPAFAERSGACGPGEHCLARYCGVGRWMARRVEAEPCPDIA